MTPALPELPAGNVRAIAALTSLRDAYPYLAVTAEAEARQPIRDGGRPRSAAARALEDELLRVEREERLDADRRGIRQFGVSNGPVRTALLDAEIIAETTVIDQAWIAASALRQTETWLASPTPLRGRPGWEPACTYLAVSLWDVAEDLAARMGRELARADAVIRAACNLQDVRIPLPGCPDCPACGRRGLRIDITSPENRNWTITCRPDCRCVGTQCSCGRPGRTPGQVHIWPAGEFAARFGAVELIRRARTTRPQPVS